MAPRMSMEYVPLFMDHSNLIHGPRTAVLASWRLSNHNTLCCAPSHMLHKTHPPSQVLQDPSQQRLACVSVSPSGRYIALGGEDETLKVTKSVKRKQHGLYMTQQVVRCCVSNSVPTIVEARAILDDQETSYCTAFPSAHEYLIRDRKSDTIKVSASPAPGTGEPRFLVRHLPVHQAHDRFTNKSSPQRLMRPDPQRILFQ